MIDLDALEAAVAEGEKKNFFVAPIVKELIAELREARGERAAGVAWLRGEPERLVECNGHRHADGKPCWVMSPMPADELADAIERGEHRRS